MPYDQSNPQAQLGLVSPPVTPPTPPAAGGPQMGLGGDYNQLFQDASQYYLQNGGSQANVNAYQAANPGQNYTQLASDAAQWYTDPNRPDANTDWSVAAVMPQGGGPQTNIPTQQDYTDLRNQSVGNYFGVQPPPPGQGFTYPQPGAGKNGQRMIPDPSMAIHKGDQRPGYFNNQPGSPGQGPNQEIPGGVDLLQSPAGSTTMPYNTQQSDYYNQHSNDAFQAGANRGPYSVNSGVEGKDPWLQDTRPFQWEGGTPPNASMTQAGSQAMAQPLSAGGQQFPSLQEFLRYMMTSTPGQQGIKGQLEGLDAQGGSLQEGENTLFSQLAPYLTQNSLQSPAGATPFTNWDPMSLLTLLLKSGIAQRPG